VQSLEVSSPPDTLQPIADLAACPALANLVDLNLFLPNDVSDEAVKALAGSSYLANLQRLRLSAYVLGDKGLAALLDAPHLAGLGELTLDVETGRFSPALWQRYQARFGKS
jgi:hypothetical protein